jgi:hypothetical protein
MTKFGTIVLLLAGIVFASLAIGTIFVSWLIVPLGICIIVCDVFVDDLPPWFILNDAWGIAKAFAVSCLFISVFTHHSTFTPPAVVSHDQVSVFGAFWQLCLMVLCLSVTSFAYSHWLKPRIENCYALQVWMHKRMMKRISIAFERCQIPAKGNRP